MHVRLKLVVCHLKMKFFISWIPEIVLSLLNIISSLKIHSLKWMRRIGDLENMEYKWSVIAKDSGANNRKSFPVWNFVHFWGLQKVMNQTVCFHVVHVLHLLAYFDDSSDLSGDTLWSGDLRFVFEWVLPLDWRRRMNVYFPAETKFENYRRYSDKRFWAASLDVNESCTICTLIRAYIFWRFGTQQQY